MTFTEFTSQMTFTEFTPQIYSIHHVTNVACVYATLEASQTIHPLVPQK